MAFWILTLGNSLSIKVTHETLIISKLIEDKFHCKLRLSWYLELRYSITEYDILFAHKYLLKKLHPARANAWEEHIHYHTILDQRHTQLSYLHL